MPYPLRVISALSQEAVLRQSWGGLVAAELLLLLLLGRSVVPFVCATSWTVDHDLNMYGSGRMGPGAHVCVDTRLERRPWMRRRDDDGTWDTELSGSGCAVSPRLTFSLSVAQPLQTVYMR